MLLSRHAVHKRSDINNLTIEKYKKQKYDAALREQQQAMQNININSPAVESTNTNININPNISLPDSLYDDFIYNAPDLPTATVTANRPASYMAPQRGSNFDVKNYMRNLTRNR